MLKYLRAMRVHHWAKNILIFLPALMGHQILQPEVMIKALLAFLAFGMTASSGYLFNDIIDLSSDQANAYKSKRPLASGELSKNSYFSMSIILLCSAAFISAMISTSFAIILACYFILSISYSYIFKSALILDVLILAGFYAFRVFAGSVATNVMVSEWLLSFCIFFFLSLALAKRASELIKAKDDNVNKRRAYRKTDLNVVSQLGVSSGLISVLVLAFYVTSDHVTKLYLNPQVLWGLCMVLVYWISRFWILVSQGEVEEDPVVFALKDISSYVCLGVILTIVVFAL